MTTKLSLLDSTSQAAGLKAFMQPVLDEFEDTDSYTSIEAFIAASGLTRITVNPISKGAIGGNPAADTAAFRAAIAECVTKGHVLEITRPPSGEWFNINDDVWGAWPITGGFTDLRWPCLLYVQQTLVSEHRIHGVSRKVGTSSGGSMFYAAGNFPVGSTLPDRAMWRMGATSGEIFTAGHFWRVHFFGNDVPGLIGVYGDGLQENAGLTECNFQGFRQCASFPYAPSVPVSNAGRNANFHLLYNEFNNRTPVETTTDGIMSAGDTVVPLTSTTELYAGDYLWVATTLGYHRSVVESVSSGVSATLRDPLPSGDSVIAGAEVHHAAVCVDVWGGAANLIERNTAIQYNATRPVAPCFRLAGTFEARSLHGESCWSVVELGGWLANNDASGGNEVTFGSSIRGVTGNDAEGVGDMAMVYVTDREALSAGYRSYIRSCEISGLTNVSGADYLLIDEGGSSTGREAISFDVATYGDSMAEPYVIGAAYPSAAYGPRTFTNFQEGRRAVAFADGAIDAFDPTYAKYFRVTSVGSSTGTTSLRSIVGIRFDRQLVFANTNASHTFWVIHNTSSDSAQFRIWSHTRADLAIGPNDVVRFTYGIGPNVQRWFAEKL